ncbi:MAG: aldose 1-epimerase family protein, partial [Lachnospiraceae bacterium]
AEYIKVEFQAPLFGIWSPEKKQAPFICIEPWYGRCDRETFEGRLKDREWGNKLAPGEVFERSYTITFR